MLQDSLVSSSCSLSGSKLFRCVLFLPLLFIFLTIHASASRLQQVPGPAPTPEPKPPCPSPGPRNTTFPAIFAFGDSIVDTGNNDYILTLIRANFLPYGMDFPHGTPTGRFCNGKIPADFIGDHFAFSFIMSLD